MKHLEQLDLQGQPAPAYALMEGFGFPDSYATLISPSGEYQIGTKVYWFHDGFKYEAGSREELSSIKLNPSLAKYKTKAGSELIKCKTKYTPANLTQQNGGYDFDKYAFQFYWKQELRSLRRITFATNVYSESYGTDYGAIQHFWYSYIYIKFKYDYYSTGSNRWYPRNDEQFTWFTSHDFTGIVGMPDLISNGGQKTRSYYDGGSFSNGRKSIELASDALSSYDNGNPNRHSAADVRWTFEITGRIYGYPTYDYPNGYFNLGEGGGQVLW